MKKFLKIAGVLFGVAVIGFGVWYLQALQVEGDPMLTACHAVDLYDDVTGEKIVGVEDMDFDPATGAIFMSAYDRRAVAREIEEGNVTTQGGIYTVSVSAITEAPSIKVTDISRAFKEAGNEFRPHGFSFTNWEGVNYIHVINRRYQPRTEEIPFLPVLEEFELLNRALIFHKTYEDTQVCDLYDVGYFEGYLLVTDFTYPCQGEINFQELIVDYENEEHVLSANAIRNRWHPNGIVMWGKDNITYSYTLDKTIHVYYSPVKQGFGPFETLILSIFPDNLTTDEGGNLYVAGFPNLIDYYFYMQGWLGVKKSPSAVYRFGPNEDHLKDLRREEGVLAKVSGNEFHTQTLLYKDSGEMISGATVALRAGDYLLLGSAWDDNIAICSGMDKIS